MQDIQYEGTNGEFILPISFRDMLQASDGTSVADISWKKKKNHKRKGEKEGQVSLIFIISNHTGPVRQYLKLFL